jgi:hypothetical protein
MDKILAYSTLVLAVCTALVAAFTAVLALATFRLAKESRESSFKQNQQSRADTLLLVKESQESTKRQISVQTWLEFKKTFDSVGMMKARGLLANKAHFSVSNVYFREYGEPVLDFFEDLAILYFMGFIDRELTKGTFAFPATRWWAVMKPHIDEQRARHNDLTMFENFERFAAKMLDPDEVLKPDDLRHFLFNQLDFTDTNMQQTGMQNLP